jgi:hypothetical protein
MKYMKFKIRDLRDKYFQIDDVYLNGYAKLLNPYSTAVYLSLCRHASKDQECFPSQKLIAEEHNITTKSVKRAIKKLRDINIIAVIQERNVGGKWLNNVYVLLDKSMWKKIPGDFKTPRHRGTLKSKTVGSLSPLKDTHKKDTHLSLLPLSQKNIEPRERILKEIKNYFPNHTIPNSIKTEKLDLLIYKIEKGEVDPGKIKSVSAYLKGLQDEPFPSFVERLNKREKEKEKIKIAKKKTEEKKVVDETWANNELKFEGLDTNTKELLIAKAKQLYPGIGDTALRATAISLLSDLN